MINKTTLDFLSELSLNNTSTWVADHKNQLDAAKSDILNLTTQIVPLIAAFDPKISSDSNPKDFIMRLNRDTRFGANKKPYKDNFGLWFTPLENKGNEPAYYLHIQPGASYLAGAFWSPDVFGLQMARNLINKDFLRFSAILNAKGFKDNFCLMNDKALKNVPKGYEADNPAAEFLKLKSYEANMKLSDQALLRKDFANEVALSFKKIQPFVDFFRNL